jgi:hypothetical protein
VIAIFLVVAVTMNGVFALLFGAEAILSLPRFMAVLASNLFLWAGFGPLWRQWSDDKAPSLAAAQSLAAACLFASFVWHFYLYLVPERLSIAVALAAVGLFIALQMSLRLARKGIGAPIAGKQSDAGAMRGADALARVVAQALDQLSSARAGPIVHELEVVERRARRKEYPGQLLSEQSVQAALARLRDACRRPADSAEIEAAAQGLVASVGEA